MTNITEPDAIALLLQDLVAGFEESHLLGIGSDTSTCFEALPHFGSVSFDDPDHAFVDAEVTACPLDRIIPSSHCKLGFGFLSPPSPRTSTELHHPLPPAEVSEPGTFGTLEFCSFGDDQRTSPGVPESDHPTNAEFSLVYSEPDPHRTHCETSLIHIPRRPSFPHDPPAVTSRELILYLRHPRAGKLTILWPLGDVSLGRAVERGGWPTGQSVSLCCCRRSW